MKCPECKAVAVSYLDDEGQNVTHIQHAKSCDPNWDEDDYFIGTPDQIEAVNLADSYLNGEQCNRILRSDIAAHFRAAFANILKSEPKGADDEKEGT